MTYTVSSGTLNPTLLLLLCWTHWLYYTCLLIPKLPPHTAHSHKSHKNTGGGTVFIVKELFRQAPSTVHTYTLFEASAYFGVYQLPTTSEYAKPFPHFLKNFAPSCVLLSAATISDEFLITRDSNIHNWTLETIAFLSVVSDANLTQHVSFSTQ